MGHQGRISRVGDQPGDAIDDADPPVGQGQQRHAAIGGDAPAIEGRADFLARHAWQIEQKIGIVIHGGRGASVVREQCWLRQPKPIPNQPVTLRPPARFQARCE